MLNKDYTPKVNTKLKLYYRENNINNKIIHIRAIVDNGYFVYKCYNKTKGWIYKVEPFLFLKLNAEFLTEKV